MSTRRPWFLAAGLFAALFTCTLPTTAAESSVAEPSIEVLAPQAVDLTNWPLSVGVPLPRGFWQDGPTHLGLHPEDGAGPAVPVQMRALAHWPEDGSVRWGLVDANVDAVAGASRRYTLRPMTAPQEGPVVRVVDGEEAIVVDTGVLHFTVPKRHFAILEDVKLGGEPLATGSLGSFMSIESRHYDARPPSHLRVLAGGPQRARIELRGEFGADFHYVVRIDAYAGQAFVRVLHSLEHRGARAFSSVRHIGVDLPLPPSDGSWGYRAGRVDDAPIAGPLGSASVVLLQGDPVTLKLDGEEVGGRTAGWAAVHDGTKGIAIAGRFMWEEFPKGFHLSADKLRYNLWAPEAMPAAIGMGVAKTHEFVVAFFGAEMPTDSFLDQMAEPLTAQVDAEWLAATKALPGSIASRPTTEPFLEALREGFERYIESIDSGVWDDWGSLDCSEIAGERPRRGYYGMLNWGDWNFPWYRDMVNGCETWGNLEYDLTQVVALGFAATGEREMYRYMVAAARHFMDVDRVHTLHAPCHDCYGTTHPRVARHFSFELGEPSLGYVWTEGLLSYYFLTGDERALAAVRDIADFLVRRIPADGTPLRPREWGWPLVALVSTYDATGDLRYKRAARAFARQAVRDVEPTRGRDVGMGTLADGIAYTHSILPNRTLRVWLEAHAAAVMSAPPGVADPRYFPAVAYVAPLLGDVAYEKEALDAVARQSFGTWGKPFTLAGRNGFRILSLLD